jgi:PAS domain S-box-containing protein
MSLDFYETFLQERRAAIVEAIAADAIAEIPAYRALPEGAARLSLNQTMGVLLDALRRDDLGVVVEWVERVLLARFNQGMTFEQAILLPAFFRRHVVQASLDALESGIAETRDGIAFINRACDRIIELIGRYYRETIEATSADLRRFQLLAESALDGIALGSVDFRVAYANPAFQRMTGYDERLVGMSVGDVLDPAALDELRDTIVPALHEQGAWSGEVRYRHADGTTFPVQISIAALRDRAGSFDGTAVVARDIREQRAQELERARLQQEIIEAQDLALRELSTPLLAVSDRVVVLPLIGTVDSRRAQQVIETLLEGITASGADTAILDITGVPVVDTQVANALLRAAQAVRLLGAQVVLTGIRPEVAQTLVGMGANLSEIVSRATLQSGIAYALG